MKTNSLLFIASLAVLTSSASAASNQTESEPVVLPTYVVTAPRYLPVEQQINASLKEFSRQAAAVRILTPELPGLKAEAARRTPLANIRTAPPAHLAKS
jgi:hypothetical protein